MLQWLYDSVNWLVSQFGTIFHLVTGFISNPYPYIATFLDWVYNRAVGVILAVKKEIADWTYGLYVDLVNWRNWFYSVLNSTVLPFIANVQQWIANQQNIIVALVSPIINSLIGTINGWINWFQAALSNAITLATNVYNLVVNYVFVQLANLVVGINNISSLVSGFNFNEVWQSIGDFKRFVNDVPLLIRKVVIDGLLDWLEEKIAEALE